MMETSPAPAITHYESDCQQSYQGLVSDIRQALREIEEAYKHLSETAPADPGNFVLVQALQHCSALPIMLGQQLRMIDGLEQKFGEQFRSKCHEEVEEMASLSKGIREALKNPISSMHGLDLAAQSHLVDSLFNSTSRLNLLQQRISGKMMKVKLASNGHGQL